MKETTVNNISLLASTQSSPLYYSRGTSKYDNAPEQRAASTFDEFETEVLEDRSVQKGLAYVCAPLARGVHYQNPGEHPGESHWRLANHALPRAFLPFDFDGFASVAAFQATLAYLEQYRGFGYTTASATPEAPRARAILQASRPVTRDEAKVIGEKLQAEILAALGPGSIKFDDSVYRGEQPVYTPVVTSTTFHFSGGAVDVDALLASPSEMRAVGGATSVITAEYLASLPAGLVIPDKINDGEGREDFILRYAGHLRGKGLDQSTIERILLDYNAAHVVPPVDDEIVLDRARRYSPAGIATAANDGDWPDLKPLDETLPPVPPFPVGLLPDLIGKYVVDVAERMSCPVDFPAMAAVVALSSAIGSQIYCKPYGEGTWLVPGGAWGICVGSPSAIKSPPLSEMLKPLYLMDKQAADQYAKDLEHYTIAKAIYDKAVKAAINNGTTNVGMPPPGEPNMKRYIVNDSTYEMLVAIAKANPSGFLVWRDELVGWFHSLNKENQKEARGLYLTGWSGTEGYATDRIGRGHVRADRINISLLGTIQPNVLRSLVYDAVSGGAGDDGLVARFQLAVFPDPVRDYVKVDRAPNMVAMRHYEETIRNLSTLDPRIVGASLMLDGTACLPFDVEAQQLFDDWRQGLEGRLRDPQSDEHPAMLAHLGKYRSLFPKLALVMHLADGQTGPIGRTAAARAKIWLKYLEAHARRIYHTATNRAMQSAVALANKIKAGRLADGFTRSDVLVKEWAGLRTADEVTTALTVLRDMNWLTSIEDRRTGGRPAEHYYISPKVKRAA